MFVVFTCQLCIEPLQENAPQWNKRRKTEMQHQQMIANARRIRGEGATGNKPGNKARRTAAVNLLQGPTPQQRMPAQPRTEKEPGALHLARFQLAHSALVSGVTLAQVRHKSSPGARSQSTSEWGAVFLTPQSYSNRGVGCIVCGALIEKKSMRFEILINEISRGKHPVPPWQQGFGKLVNMHASGACMAGAPIDFTSADRKRVALPPETIAAFEHDEGKRAEWHGIRDTLQLQAVCDGIRAAGTVAVAKEATTTTQDADEDGDSIDGDEDKEEDKVTQDEHDEMGGEVGSGTPGTPSEIRLLENGARIDVKWDSPAQWFRGTVREHSNDLGSVLVLFDADNDRAWIDRDWNWCRVGTETEE